MLDLLIFSNMIGRKMASGKMLDLLLWSGLFFVLFFFCLWTAMNMKHLHGCLMKPLLPRETNLIKLAYSVNLGMNQNKWFLVCD